MTWIVNHLKLLGAKIALIDGFGTFTYSDLHTQIKLYKQQLDESIED
ncbi:MAG: hypothetical protein ACJAS1_006946, partial [Oleiphilaceae bacterium]